MYNKILPSPIQKVNSQQRTLIFSSAGVIIGSLLILLFITGDKGTVPVGVQVNQTQGSSDDVKVSDDLDRSQRLTAGRQDQFTLSDNIVMVLSSSHGGVSSFGGGGGHHGGGGSRDTTPPAVRGIFSREPDTINDEYTHPVTVTWVGDDRPGGSGIASCKPRTNYSGPDGVVIVLTGWCTDTAGNNGTGSVTFKYNSSSTNGLRHIYDLRLNSSSVSLGSSISANATTNNTSINDVRFEWRNPLHVIAANNTVSTVAHDGNRSAVDIFAAEQTGKWTVKAHFLDNAGNDVIDLEKNFNVTRHGGGGENHTPVAVNDTSTTPEDTPVVIDVLANDVDADDDTLTIFSSTQAEHGLVTKNANGTFTYSPDHNFNGQDAFKYRIFDGFTQSNNATVTILVTESRIVDAGPDQIVNEETLVTLHGSVKDDSSELTFNWTQIFGLGDPVVSLLGIDTLSPTFTSPAISHTTFPPLQVMLTFKLVANNTSGSIGSDTVLVTINDVNRLPKANAGTDQFVNECSSSDAEDEEDHVGLRMTDIENGGADIAWHDDEECSERAVVTLDGTGSSDADDDDLAYDWEEIQGPSVELDDANSAKPLFTAPQVDEDTPLIFNLTVSDGFGGSSSDLVKIKILNNEGGGGAGGKIKVTGGGGLGKKVNFGFVAQSSDDEVKGNLEYQDKGIHINVHSISITSLDLLDDNRATFRGRASVNGEGEYAFVVIAEDNGEPGRDDWFSIDIPGLDYHREGTLAKGNIQVHG